MLRNGFFLFLFACAAGVTGQTLKPSIGLFSPPAPQDSICNIPVYTGSFAASGLFAGDTVPDFTLYKRNGTTVNLLSTLQQGKPVLLVAGSYTCPVFRNRLPELNAIAGTYQNDISVFVVYVVEAHPAGHPSPYSGTLWVTSQNQQEGVLYPQPATYGQRLRLIDTMNAHIQVIPEILADGPCNEWWSAFGPAPNNAYLIDTTGIVFSKHDWFNKPPLSMECDIDSLLGNPPCAGNSGLGTFQFYLENDSLEFESPGNTIYVKGQIVNASAQGVTIDIVRTAENVPSGWSTAMCTDICLGDWIDSTDLYLNPGDSQRYTMYIYTDMVPESGSATIEFRNRNLASNRHVQNFYGSTLAPGIGSGENPVTVSPNPAEGSFLFRGIGEGAAIEIYDKSGKLVLKENGADGTVVRIENAGLYLYRVTRADGKIFSGKLIVN